MPCHRNVRLGSNSFSVADDCGEYEESINIIHAVSIHNYQIRPIISYILKHEP